MIDLCQYTQNNPLEAHLYKSQKQLHTTTKNTLRGGKLKVSCMGSVIQTPLYAASIVTYRYYITHTHTHVYIHTMFKVGSRCILISEVVKVSCWRAQFRYISIYVCKHRHVHTMYTRMHITHIHIHIHTRIHEDTLHTPTCI